MKGKKIVLAEFELYDSEYYSINMSLPRRGLRFVATHNKGRSRSVGAHLSLSECSPKQKPPEYGGFLN